MVQDSDFLPKTEKKEKTVKIEIGQFFDEETFREVMRLEQETFPGELQYDDEEEYFREALKNPENINVVARKEGRLIGYMLVVPQPKEVAELKEDDPELVEDSECLYVDTMEIDPKLLGGLASGKIFLQMIDKAVEEAIRRGYKRFCTHARKSIGLHTAMKKYFGSRVIKTREIPKWHWVADEPYEYIEGNLKEEEEK